MPDGGMGIWLGEWWNVGRHHHNEGAVVVQVGWETILSIVAGEVTYNVKDLDKNTKSKVDPGIR